MPDPSQDPSDAPSPKVTPVPDMRYHARTLGGLLVAIAITEAIMALGYFVTRHPFAYVLMQWIALIGLLAAASRTTYLGVLKQGRFSGALLGLILLINVALTLKSL